LIQRRRKNILSIYNAPEGLAKGKGRKTVSRTGARRLRLLSSPDMLPLVRHLRTPSPVRHLRTPIILTPSSPERSLISLLPRSFRSSVACPARRTDRSSAYFLISSAHQLLARRFLGRITRRLTALFVPLVGGLPNGFSDGSLIGLLPHSFHSSVAFPAQRTDRSSAYFLVFPLVSGLPRSPDGSLIDLLPRSFHSSVACPACRTDR